MKAVVWFYSQGFNSRASAIGGNDMKEHTLLNMQTQEGEGNEFMFAAQAELRNEILAGEGSPLRWIATEKF